MDKLLFEGIGSKPPQGNATDGDVLEGKTYQTGGTFLVKTGQMQNFTGMTIPTSTQNPSGTSDFNVKVPRGFFPGDEYNLSVGDPNLVPSNIKSGSSIFGVSGTYEGQASFAPIKHTIQTNATSFYQSGDDYILTFDTALGDLNPNLLGITVKFMNSDAAWEYEEGKTLNISTMTFTAFKANGELIAHEQQVDLGTSSLSVHFGGVDIQGAGINFDIVFKPSAGTITINNNNPMMSVDVWSY